ncbi:MAG TPA: TIGR03067 domain-containing protein, partial [Gemmataceae bacterium]|nr:TIGR03067 domain-containing protein [Gemmataceae bacterium]
IRDKDGKVVGKHPVPPGGSIEVKPGPAAPAAAAPDEELIKGSWRPVAGEISGEAVPKEFIDTMQASLTFADGKVTWRVNPPPALVKALEAQAGKGLVPKELPAALAKGEEGVYHLDPTKTPKTIDVTLLGPIRKTMLGIYALDGDTLKVCMAIDPDRTDQRPTDFVTKPGVLTVAVTARRLPAPPVAPKP